MNKSLLALAVSAGLAANAGANEQGVSETMIVSATRIAMPQAKILAPVSVVTAADIDRLQIRDMTQLLSRLAGLESQTAGGLGSNTSLFVRGGNTSHTLVLVDGVRMNSATLGQTSIENLDLNNIERVELLRGPASSLYGADAVSGVLNIITKRPVGTEATLRAEIGSQNLTRSSLSLANGNDQTRWSLVAGYESQTDFDRAADDDFHNNDDDVYRNMHIAASVEQRWNESLTSSISYLRNEGQVERDAKCYDDSFSRIECAPYADTLQSLLSVDTSWKVNDTLLLKGQYARAVDKSQNGDDLVTPAQVAGSDNRFRTDKDTFLVLAQITPAEGLQGVIGAEYYNDKLDTQQQYLQTERDNKALFANMGMEFGANAFSLGLRTDDDEAFGKHTTESVSWGYNFYPGWKLVASWGTGFRSPTFNDLYWPADPYGIGNPDLEPEESINTDLGVKYLSGNQDFSATLFRNKVKNLINWAPVDPNNTWGQWTPSNVSKARMEGLELEYGLRFDRWATRMTYTWIDAIDRETEQRLNDRSRSIFNLDVDYQQGQWAYGVSFKARSARFADAANARRLAGYGLVEGRISYDALSNLRLNLTLTNLLDKDYVVSEGFNEEGRGFNAGVTYSF